MDGILIRRLPLLVALAIVVSALLSSAAAPPANADDHAEIYRWPGTVELWDGMSAEPTRMGSLPLEIRQGETKTYYVRLSEQPISSRQCCGWWVRVHVNGAVRADGNYQGISWVPSVGWEFKPQGSSGPTPWRAISIRADEFAEGPIRFQHEVWDEESECPDNLHPDSLPFVTVTIVDNVDNGGNGGNGNDGNDGNDDGNDGGSDGGSDGGGRGGRGGGGGGLLPTLFIDHAAVSEGDQAGFAVTLSGTSDELVTIAYATVDGTAAVGCRRWDGRWPSARSGAASISCSRAPPPGAGRWCRRPACRSLGSSARAGGGTGWVCASRRWNRRSTTRCS